MNNGEKFCVVLIFLLSVCLFIGTIQRDRAVREREVARQETRVMAALYNGVLIGRGCEVPE